MPCIPLWNGAPIDVIARFMHNYGADAGESLSRYLHDSCCKRGAALGMGAVLVAGQALENRAVWPSVPIAMLGKMRQNVAHFLELGNTPVQLGDVLKRDCLHFGAGTGAIVPERQQLAD